MRENLKEEISNARVLTSLVANPVGVKLMRLILKVAAKPNNQGRGEMNIGNQIDSFTIQSIGKLHDLQLKFYRLLLFR